jgi:hypothetical protein
MFVIRGRVTTSRITMRKKARGKYLTWRFLLNLTNSIRERRPDRVLMMRNLGMGGDCRIIPELQLMSYM